MLALLGPEGGETTPLVEFTGSDGIAHFEVDIEPDSTGVTLHNWKVYHPPM